MSGDDDVTSNRAVRQIEERIRELERQLGRKTLEVEILKESLKHAASLRSMDTEPKPHSRRSRLSRCGVEATDKRAERRETVQLVLPSRSARGGGQ